MEHKFSVMPNNDYVDACNAIREKGGTTAPIKSGEMGAKIRAIPSADKYEAMLDGIIDRSITEIRNDMVKSIGNYAFQSCKALTTANFSEVVIIKDSAFLGCRKLEKVSFPKSEIIQGYAFRYCVALVSAEFPVALNIGSFAFQECSALVTIELPKAMMIGELAFSSCDALIALCLPGTTLCQASGDLGLYSTCKIYVPASLIEQYKSATNWSKYASQFVAIEGV